MYYLTENNTNRALPGYATGIRLMCYAKRANGESIGFDNGGELALLLDADGKTLAQWQFDKR